jgi:hypothetical protein
MSRLYFITLFALLFAVAVSVRGQTPGPLRLNLGNAALGNWTDLRATADGASATLAVPGQTGFRYPDGPRGFHKHGFRTENDGTIDWMPFLGLRADIRLLDAREVELTAAVESATTNGPDNRKPCQSPDTDRAI